MPRALQPIQQRIQLLTWYGTLGFTRPPEFSTMERGLLMADRAAHGSCRRGVLAWLTGQHNENDCRNESQYHGARMLLPWIPALGVAVAVS